MLQFLLAITLRYRKNSSSHRFQKQEILCTKHMFHISLINDKSKINEQTYPAM